jgi:hypothetical protein
MALISSVSMTLMVKGTLQSEFLTMFWPMRLTYSVITGSLMNFVLFSISSAYCLPILISPSVEYQLPMPRAPMLRVPTALTSSMLPPFTPGIMPFWSGSACLNGFTLGSVMGLPVLAVEASSGVGALDGGAPLEQMSPPLSAERWRTGPGQLSATEVLAAGAAWAGAPMPPACCGGRRRVLRRGLRALGGSGEWSARAGVEGALGVAGFCACADQHPPARARPAHTSRLNGNFGGGHGRTLLQGGRSPVALRR